MNKEWNIINPNPTGEIVTEILKKRGIKDIKHFLNPVPSDLIPLDKLSDIDKGVSIVDNGIKENKRFTVFPDMADSDGIMAGSLMKKYLLHFVDEVNFVGGIGKQHGLKNLDLDKIIAITDILIIVDSSTGDHIQQNYLQEHGVTIVICDHHPEPRNLKVCTINSQFDSYPNGQLSGSGVTWKFCLALDKKFKTNYALEYIDLAAIGILADVSSVSESFMENRLIVNMGLKNLNNTAIKLIIGAYEFNSQSVLFSISPLINAAARMFENQLALDFLMEDDRKKARKLFVRLKEVKEQQKILVEIATNKINLEIEKQDYINKKVICGFVDKGEFTGLIGSKLCEKYGRPAIILKTPTKEGVQITGSIRAIGIPNFKSVINSTGLSKSKGHESAAGIFIPNKKLDLLLEKLNEILKDVEFKTEEDIDIQLEPEEITNDLIKQMEKINRLTGKDFKSITVFIEKAEVKNVGSLKDGRHTKFNIDNIEVLKWNSRLYEDLKWTKGIYQNLDVVGSLSLGNFKGVKTKQLILKDTRNLESHLEFFR